MLVEFGIFQPGVFGFLHYLHEPCLVATIHPIAISSLDNGPTCKFEYFIFGMNTRLKVEQTIYSRSFMPPADLVFKT